MHRTINILSAALLILPALCSCSESNPVREADGDTVEYGFTMCGTRSGDSGTLTYRAMLHTSGGNPGEFPYAQKSGTYRGPDTDGRQWLTACEVDPLTGTWIADSHQYGLRATRGKYYLSFVSPAVAPKQYQSNPGSSKEWGFLQHRQPLAGEPELFISTPVLIDSLKGNHLKNQYVYDVPDDVVLKGRRSKVTLKVKCGDDLASATVKKVGWTNIYESCYYNLRLDTFDNFTLSAPTDTSFVFMPDTPLTLTPSDEPVTVCSDFPVFPLRYSQKDEHDEYVYETPEIDFYVAEGVAKLKVYHNIEAQYTYTYTVTINSAYVSLVVSAAPWDERSPESAAVDETPSFFYTFDNTLWNEKDPQVGEIN